MGGRVVQQGVLRGREIIARMESRGKLAKWLVVAPGRAGGGGDGDHRRRAQRGGRITSAAAARWAGRWATLRPAPGASFVRRYTVDRFRVADGGVGWGGRAASMPCRTPLWPSLSRPAHLDQ